MTGQAVDNRGPDRLNRRVLVLLSLLLLGAGGYALARGYEAFGAEPADDEVLLEPVRDFVSRYQTWFWIVVLGLCLIVAYLALRWLVAQFRSPGSRRWTSPATARRGPPTSGRQVRPTPWPPTSRPTGA